jgi:hypothetical protein
MTLLIELGLGREVAGLGALRHVEISSMVVVVGRRMRSERRRRRQRCGGGGAIEATGRARMRTYGQGWLGCRVRDVLRIKTVCGLHSKSFQLPFNTSIPQSSTLLIL